MTVPVADTVEVDTSKEPSIEAWMSSRLMKVEEGAAGGVRDPAWAVMRMVMATATATVKIIAMVKSVGRIGLISLID